MEILILAIRLILFGVFAISSITKFLDREGTEKAVRDFGVPERLSGASAFALPVAEIAIAACFLFLPSSWIGAAAALLLLLAFTGGMIWQLRLGRAPDCHCFGQLHSEPVGTKSLIRNGFFLLLAGTLLIRGPEGQGVDLFAAGIEAVPTLLALLLLVLAIVLLGYLANLTKQQNDIIRRLGILELSSGQGNPVERNNAGDPSDGLPIGTPVPDFAIPGLDGRVVQFDHLIVAGKPFLFLFVGAECAPCEQLFPEIKEWEQDLADKVRFVIVSHGDVDVNRRKFGELGTLVLIESGRELANTVHAKWTPSAVFVDSDGNVASHLAAGDVAIRRLVEQMKLKDLSEKFVYFLGMGGQKRPDIGREIPDFQATGYDGKELSKSDLIGRKTLAAFVSTTCGHCSRLMDEIRDWEAQGDHHGLQIVIFSDGADDDEKSRGIRAPMIVDKHYKLAAKFGMRGVPSAVLIDDTGTIVTEAAIGPENIWSLIGIRSV